MLSLEEDYKNTLEMLDEQTRQRSVIDFISSHQGCTAEDIVNGNKLTERGKTFRILKELKRENVIAEQKSDKNRRDKKLYLNDTNPLVSFPKEVKEFKTIYTHYLEKRNIYVWAGNAEKNIILVTNSWVNVFVFSLNT